MGGLGGLGGRGGWGGCCWPAGGLNLSGFYFFSIFGTLLLLLLSLRFFPRFYMLFVACFLFDFAAYINIYIRDAFLEWTLCVCVCESRYAVCCLK